MGLRLDSEMFKLRLVMYQQARVIRFQNPSSENTSTLRFACRIRTRRYSYSSKYPGDSAKCAARCSGVHPRLSRWLISAPMLRRWCTFSVQAINSGDLKVAYFVDQRFELETYHIQLSIGHGEMDRSPTAIVLGQKVWVGLHYVRQSLRVAIPYSGVECIWLVLWVGRMPPRACHISRHLDCPKASQKNPKACQKNLFDGVSSGMSQNRCQNRLSVELTTTTSGHRTISWKSLLRCSAVSEHCS